MFTNEELEAVYKVIYKRRDIRSFRPDPVPEEKIQRILQAAHHGPSVGYMQPWNFILVTSEEIKEKLAWAADKERRALAIHYEDKTEKEAKFLRLKVEGLGSTHHDLCDMRPDKRGFTCAGAKFHSGNRYLINRLCDSKHVACCLRGRSRHGVGEFL